MKQMLTQNLWKPESSPSTFWDLFGEAQRDRLIAAKRELTLGKEQPVYHQGDTPAYLYYVREGSIKIFRKGSAGRCQTLRFIPTGDVFGYRAALAEDIYVVGAEAFEPSIVWAFPIELIHELMEEIPQLALLLVKQLARELGLADRRLVSLTQGQLRGRLADTLLFLRRIYGVNPETKMLRVQLTRRELADLSNMSTANAIRTLAMLAKEGAVRIEGRHVRIVDEYKLHHISLLG